jgi:hypothetical protein
MIIFLPSRNGSLSKAGATHVVLPLPGGADKTNEAFEERTARISSSFSSTGNIGF